MIDIIKQGSIVLKTNFLNNEEFLFAQNIFNNFEFYETYQPSEVYYGNRLQAYPCYQHILNESDNLIFKNKLSQELNSRIELTVIARKIYTKEILESKCNTKYGYVHEDMSDIAGVLHFDQTCEGGTAFFENSWDKYPDISVGAYPNRLLLYNAKRYHAPCHDFTFEERRVLAFMINLI